MTTRRIYDEIVPFELPAGLGSQADRVLAVAAGARSIRRALDRSQADRILAVAADHDARSIRGGLDAFSAAGVTTAVVRNADHAWNAEHPQLFSDMVAAWVTDRTVTPGLVVSPEPRTPR